MRIKLTPEEILEGLDMHERDELLALLRKNAQQSTAVMLMEALRHGESRKELLAQMEDVLLPWETDGSAPPNYQRKTLLGAVLAEVNVHNPPFRSEENGGAERGVYTLSAGSVGQVFRETRIARKGQGMPSYQITKDEIKAAQADLDDFLREQGLELL